MPYDYTYLAVMEETWPGVVVSDPKKKVTGDKKLKETFLGSYIILFCFVELIVQYILEPDGTNSIVTSRI